MVSFMVSLAVREYLNCDPTLNRCNSEALLIRKVGCQKNKYNREKYGLAPIHYIAGKKILLPMHRVCI